MLAAILADIVGLLIDCVLGSRCNYCRERSFNLSLHEYTQHAGDLGVPVEPSRFDARGWRAP